MPKRFRLAGIVHSHGWFDLPPFAWESDSRELRYTAWIAGRPASLSLKQVRTTLQLSAERRGSWSHRANHELVETVRRILALDLDPSPFFAATAPRYDWARDLGLGRLLRGGTLFEDAIKLLATTNCSWAMTRTMVHNLVATSEETAPNGSRPFPTPERLADLPEEYFRSTIRAGYRAGPMRLFAEQVAQGTLDLATWEQFSGSTADLVRAVCTVRGFGPYVAESLAKLLGRFDGLALDSWCVAKFAQLHSLPRGTDIHKRISAEYEPFGRWRGLALWLDLTRDWHRQGGVLVEESTSFGKS